MKRSLILLVAMVLAVTVPMGLPMVTQGSATADITVFDQDRPGWESAVGVYEEECFTDTTLNPGVSVISEYPGYIDTAKGMWWDRLVCPADGLTTTTWQFDPPIVAFGGNWDPGIPGGPGARIAVAIDGSWVSVGEIPETYTGQFWGFVSTEPFSVVRLSPGSNCNGAWCETYELDNMVYKPYVGSFWVRVTSETGASICNDSVDFSFARNLMKGSNGDDVKYLQILLNSNPVTQVATEGAGSPGSETDYFGSLTESAVKKFQNIRNLTENGILDGDTLTALNELLREYAPVKRIPNRWVLKVIDRHENSEIHDGCIWWEVEDVTDGIRGWVAYKSNTDKTTYLVEIEENVGEERTQEISNENERKSIIVSAVRNRATLFHELSSFPSELLLAIIAGEMTYNADNTYISFDCGRGISQITSNGLVGSYSGVKCYGGTTKGYMPHEFVYPFDRSITQSYWTGRSCETGSYKGETTYRDCNCKGEQECAGEQAWYYGGTDTSGRCKYYGGCDDGCRVYTNTVQGIEANLKDGKGALGEFYVHSIGKNENTESNFKFTTQLKKDDKGKEVAYLQYILKSEIDQNLAVTADFGSMTEQALKDFQSREFPSKQPSGIVDQDTRNLLNTLLDNAYSYLRNRVEEIKSWVGATWRYNHGYPSGTIKSDEKNYLFSIANRLEGLDSYFQDYKTQLGNDLLNEADRQFLLSMMKNYQYFEIRSPIELRIYDSQGGVTGVINGQLYENIPDSIYDEGNEVAAIFLPSGGYIYEVVGTDTGLYGLEGGSIQDGEIVIFNAIDIPVNANTIHRYLIAWEALSQGEEGVTLQIDADGDGVFEHTIQSDGELTYDEFILQTETNVDFDPDVLNLRSKGSFVTVYIELPEDFDVGEIDVSSIRLNGTVRALDWPTEIGDYNDNGIPDLMVKFDRAGVQEILEPGRQVEITITGDVAGIAFQGSDTIRVMDN